MWLVAPYWTAQNTTITIEKSLRVRQESKRDCYSLEKFLLKMAKMRWFGTWRCELNLYSHSVCLFILEDVRSTLCIHLFINLTNSYWKSTLYQGCVGQWRHNTQKANYLLLSHCSSLYFYLYLLPDRGWFMEGHRTKFWTENYAGKYSGRFSGKFSLFLKQEANKCLELLQPAQGDIGARLRKQILWGEQNRKMRRGWAPDDAIEVLN